MLARGLVIQADLEGISALDMDSKMKCLEPLGNIGVPCEIKNFILDIEGFMKVYHLICRLPPPTPAWIGTLKKNARFQLRASTVQAKLNAYLAKLRQQYVEKNASLHEGAFKGVSGEAKLGEVTGDMKLIETIFSGRY